MTRITSACPTCGRVDLEVDDVTLVVSPREDSAWYLFDCRGCVQRVVKPAPATVAVALGSVQVRVWTVPAEMLERVGPGEAPTIGNDDLLDVILDLRGGDPRDGDLREGDLREGDLREGDPRDGGQTAAQAEGDVIELPDATTPSPDATGSRPARPNAV